MYPQVLFKNRKPDRITTIEEYRDSGGYQALSGILRNKSIEDVKKEIKVSESLVVLTAVEKSDSDVKKVVEKLVENIIDVAKQVKANTIVLYPYAHLSSNLASPEIATEVLDSSEKQLKKKYKVVKAPFGYYKQFEIKVKGHPLSELSREIRLDLDKETKEIATEEKYDAKSGAMIAKVIVAFRLSLKSMIIPPS